MSINKELLSTKETALLLNISVSTVRRLSDSNQLKCTTVTTSKYRKFLKDDVLEFRNKYYQESDVTKSTVAIKKNITNISAKSHPAHYLMHKYWGRKANNVLNDYISFFTKEGDTVLDPFMGSGVTVIESIKLKRKAIGIDINPMSSFIVQNSISKIDFEVFEKEYKKIYKKVFQEYAYLYDTACPVCGEKSYIETSVWEHDVLKRIKGVCEEHGIFLKDVQKIDLINYEKISSLKNKLLDEKSITYPTDDIMKYVKRSGREKINELFNDRALIILSHILMEINKVQTDEIKKLLQFCFTSMLANTSKMLPGDLKKVTYKSGWVISKFWTPKVHTERNIFKCFNLRYKAIYKGKKQLENIDSKLATTILGSSTKLETINDSSVDYIFTDPPYGESIAYLALSQFWNSWISTDVDYVNEIIIDSYRKKDYIDYQTRIENVYKELYRVLKSEHYMSFTFHNRDMNVWKAILDSCLNVGFVLESIVLQEQAVSSGTQGLNKNNTLTGDFVYNFKKTSTKVQVKEKMKLAKIFIKDKITELIIANNGVTSSELYEYIIPIIAENNAYVDELNKVISIEKILKENFDYIEVKSIANLKIGESYKWIIKK